MNAPTSTNTNVQLIHGPDGAPAFVVIPYAEYIAGRMEDRSLIPHAVIERTVEGATPVRAWREHLGLTQAEVAARLGISQPAYAQQESSDRLRKASRDRIAAALGILPAQLDF
ncbi:helix-turn-helix domain-containing protein [Ralstonia pseudosolanacearum]|uniref:helix-turn-helix domain-containing protein n=1 Tax=Ralstonia pseudosolanacearum TaxID=1310165 RepID=UPI001FF8A52E|nr:helix-turn-helix transcriptional regulator [Ralstonia pseudosolanacearum]